MNTPSPQCAQCSTPFTITDDDRRFLDMLSPMIGGVKYALPEPTLCPECRLQRRMASVNQLSLYERTCDLTGKTVISNIRPEAPYKVYRQQEWHSDVWSALDYGRSVDFSRPFFDQWKELCLLVPRPSLFTGYEFDENSEYTNHAGKNKDCYLIFDSDENRECYYSYSINSCVNCSDCFRVRRSELCYECVDCVRCYASSFLQDCDNCTESLFLKNCTGCSHCILCSNLKNKEYYIENKPVSKEEFERVRALLTSASSLAQTREHFVAFVKSFPQKYMHGLQNENVVGDYLVQCKNAEICFDSENLWDCRYTYQAFMPLKNCMDIHECGDGELLYECSVAGYGAHASLFCSHMLAQFSNLLYCSLCPHSKDCFGCIGLRRQQYCILNMQYTKEEYERLVPRLIEHMRGTKEWGEFFPVTCSTYAYNESLAFDYYPMTKEEVTGRGWSWLEERGVRATKGTPTDSMPETIEETSDDCTKQVYLCSSTGKDFKIIPQEVRLYRQLHVPLPRASFFARHKARMALRNPRKLFARQCANCSKDIQTTYAPERPEKVLCERCYLETVY